MIKLTKVEIPEELQNKIRQRTERLLDLQAKGEKIPDSLATAYRDPDVKEYIKQETHDKCAYCESKISHIYYGDVEHIVPKSIRPDLTYTYSNLTYACAICNGNKSDRYDEKCPLLNPYEDSPDEDLMPIGALILRKPGHPRGHVTEAILKLNRPALIERRTEKLQQLCKMIEIIQTATSPMHRAVLEEELGREISEESEFTFIAKAYVHQVFTFQYNKKLGSC